MPDPKLKAAMKEIEGVLARHDICGSVMLASESHAENRFIFNASWSLIYFESPGVIRFRSLRRDFKTKDQQIQCVNNTVGAVFQFRDLNSANFMAMDRFCEMLKEHYQIDHTPFMGYEPHIEDEQR